MRRKVIKGKTMYALFTNGMLGNMYVQPCKVIEVVENGFFANCHNSSIQGDKGVEFFSNASIGITVFFSKDSANIKLNKKCVFSSVG